MFDIWACSEASSLKRRASAKLASSSEDFSADTIEWVGGEAKARAIYPSTFGQLEGEVEFFGLGLGATG